MRVGGEGEGGGGRRGGGRGDEEPEFSQGLTGPNVSNRAVTFQYRDQMRSTN